MFLYYECSISSTADLLFFIFPDINCINSANNGTNYKGTVNTTVSGNHCIAWTFGQINYNYDHNYCRNPDYSSKPWCYADITDHPRQECNITYCGMILSY
jgi:hypothetical protein